ncbi:MAG: hypothetical protein LBQ95_06385 [Lachnospiraceae bacterium]|jgi:hypothetical protein|nr:hypothetical protein [Lachnospiraceae bacterium]
MDFSVKYDEGKIDNMIWEYDQPDLTPEEKRLPLAKYFEKYPLLKLPPMQRQLLDAGPIDPADAITAENWLDSLQINGYWKANFGYCMMPDGSGYYVEYSVTAPNSPVKGEMNAWFVNWINFKSKGMAEGQGNLRYKLWCHPDHWDHAYVNGKDKKDGVWSFGTLNMGKTGAKNGSAEIAYEINLRDYGLSQEREDELKAAGCSFRASYEEVEGGGHLALSFNRPCIYGGTEHFKREWIGYTAKDGKIVRVPGTPCSEEYLKDVLIHNIVEHTHTQRFLPELYAEYHDKEMDAD